MCEPRRRIGVVRSSVANEAIEVDSLVIDYLKCWERSWSSKCTYSEDELRSIRCSLFGAVMRRYVRSGEMSFTRSELKQAIRSAKEIIKPVKTKQISKTVDPICYGFVSLFFSDWHESAQFSQEEQNIIFAHLYASVSTRYESTNRTKLKFTKRELKYAEECALKNRARLEKEDRQDERDRKIRGLRAKYGSAVESKVLLHD